MSLHRNRKSSGSDSSNDGYKPPCIPRWREPHDVKIAGLYDLEETIGRGHFAVVKLARHVFTGEKVAVKVIDKTKLDCRLKEHLFQEIMCMKLVQHPHIIRLYEVIDTTSKLYLILELGDGGDLYDYIMKHENGLSEAMAKKYFRQIVSAIAYCHQLHVVHRDLKPENVVFFEKFGIVKLTDFGFSNQFSPGKHLQTACGSLAYSAPEILLGDSYDAPKVDIWSLGVILYMLVCGNLPFQETNDSETLAKIMDCDYFFPSHVSPDCRRLISRMLIREPRQRASLPDILNDVWLAEIGPEDKVVEEETVAAPLIARESISVDDHDAIVSRMIEGNLSSRDAILSALDRNEYDHVTATYYLLAERKLMRQLHQRLAAQRAEKAAANEASGAASNGSQTLSNTRSWVVASGTMTVDSNYARGCSRLRSVESSPNSPGLCTPGGSGCGGGMGVLSEAGATASTTPANSAVVRILSQQSGEAEEKLRRFSMILEDDEDREMEEIETASDEDIDPPECAYVRNLLTASPLLQGGVSGSSSHASDGGESDASSSTASRPSSAASGSVAGSSSGGKSKSRRCHRHRRSLMVTRSSPQLLKNILEEEADALAPLKHEQDNKSQSAVGTSVTAGTPSSLLTFKLRHPHSHSHTHPVKPRRRSLGFVSRSSSDTSDSEDWYSSRPPRHDSDQSSDTDQPPPPPPPSGGGSGTGRYFGRSSSEDGGGEGGGGGGGGSGNNSEVPSVGGGGGGAGKCAPIREEEDEHQASIDALVNAHPPHFSCRPVSATSSPLSTRRRRTQSWQHLRSGGSLRRSSNTNNPPLPNPSSHIPSRSTSVGGGSVAPQRSESADNTPVRNFLKHSLHSLSASTVLTQSNFSLSSLASSVRSSKVMIDVIRETFEWQANPAAQKKASIYSVSTEASQPGSINAFGTDRRTGDGKPSRRSVHQSKPKLKLSCCAVS